MQIANIGNTGIQTSRLGFGTGTHGWNGSSEQTRMGHDKLVKLLRSGYDQGIRLWDSASGYGSHPHIADAMKGLDPSSITIITKTHSKSPEQVRNEIPRFIKELQTDHIDILFMHCIMNSSWLKDYSDVIDVLKQAKEKGLVRAIGMSCHDFGALKTVASADWIDVILARINYAGTNMDATPDKVVPVLEDIHKTGKGIIAMKVIGQGKLTEDVPKAIKYVTGLSCIDAMVIGMNDESQIRQNISFF